MSEKNGSELGSVKIHHDAISAIAAHVIGDISGVVRMSGSIVADLAERFGKKNLDKGIRTDVMGEEVKIEVSVILRYGAKIPEVAWQIQKKIRKAVEEITGLHVASINVNIEGIQIPKKEEKNAYDLQSESQSA